MPPRRHNTQMFALSAPPPTELVVASCRYRLVRVFKHDFWAATSLYQAIEPAEIPRIVVKFYRQQMFWGLNLEWVGHFSREHERMIYQALEGIEGIPRCVGCIGQAGIAIEYIEALPLDHGLTLPAGYFDQLRRIFDQVHERGVAYVDANKRSNMLVGVDGKAWLIDFQISIRRRDDLLWPLQAISAWAVQYMQEKDLYHLYKHKRRLAKAELRPEEEAISYHRTGMHWLHTQLTNPYRRVRRFLLRRQYTKGNLVSPTAKLEDHFQPEKKTWRDSSKENPPDSGV